MFAKGCFAAAAAVCAFGMTAFAQEGSPEGVSQVLLPLAQSGVLPPNIGLLVSLQEGNKEFLQVSLIVAEEEITSAWINETLPFRAAEKKCDIELPGPPKLRVCVGGPEGPHREFVGIVIFDDENLRDVAQRVLESGDKSMPHISVEGIEAHMLRID